MIIHNMTEMTAVHSNTSLNPEPAPPQIMLFDRFQYGNSHLRVHHEELRKIRCQHNLLATMWFSLSAPLLAATVSTWMGLSVPQNVTQSWILAITALSCIFPPLIASFVFRSFSGWVPFIQLATTFYLTAAFSLNTVLHATDFIYLAIPSAVIFTLSIFLTDDRIATKVFQVDLVLQVILIALKLDQRITWTWDIALFPTFGAYIVLFFCFLMALVMFLIAAFNSPAQLRYRKHGLAYVSISLLSISSILALLYFSSREQPLLPIYYSTLASCLLCFLPPLFYFPCRTHIFVFLSRHLSITIEAITQQAVMEKIEGAAGRLKQVSENYFIEEGKEPSSSTNLAETREKVLCTVCLSEEGEMVTMPCGHLTACYQCMSYYVETNHNTCLLCKGPMERICKIDKKDRNSNPDVTEQYTIKMK